MEHQATTRDPRVPNSTSPVEAPLAEVKRRLEDRAGLLTNPAWMDKLLALMALELRGETDSRARADQLRERTYSPAATPRSSAPTTTPREFPRSWPRCKTRLGCSAR